MQDIAYCRSGCGLEKVRRLESNPTLLSRNPVRELCLCLCLLRDLSEVKALGHISLVKLACYLAAQKNKKCRGYSIPACSWLCLSRAGGHLSRSPASISDSFIKPILKRMILGDNSSNTFQHFPLENGLCTFAFRLQDTHEYKLETNYQAA